MTVSPLQPPPWTFAPGPYPKWGFSPDTGGPLDNASLLHLFTHPECNATSPARSIFLTILPKKTIEALAPTSSVEKLGWGLYIEYKPSGLTRTVVWTGTLGLLGSIATLVALWVLKGDLDDAAGLATFVVAAVALMAMLLSQL